MTTLFNPNIVPKSATPEGHTGKYAGFLLPFYSYGYWFASGLQLTFLQSEIVQKTSVPAVLGLTRPDTFRKDASSCNGSPQVL